MGQSGRIMWFITVFCIIGAIVFAAILLFGNEDDFSD
jgi:hypothetical protein